MIEAKRKNRRLLLCGVPSLAALPTIGPAELPIYLDHNAKKCGLGRKLYEALADRLKTMGILNLYACIGYPKVEDEYLNKNGAQFHEQLGFHLCGSFENCGYKFNRWYDMIWMEKIIRGTQDRPAAGKTVLLHGIKKNP